MMKKVLLALTIIFLALGASACRRGGGGGPESTAEPVIVIGEPDYVLNGEFTLEPEPPEEEYYEPEPEPETEPEGTPFRNPLSGLPIDEDALDRRPYAIVIGNSRPALPQSGIGEADIIYEVLSEGTITRLVAVYKDVTAARIGSVRSARDYFLHFAIDHDAVFVHYGASVSGFAALRNWGVNNISGTQGDSAAFWRDPVRWGQPGLREHSAFTSAERLEQRAQARNYRTTSEAEPVFLFREEPTELNGGTATRVTVPFAQGFRPVFEFNPETGTYARFQYGMEHVDDTTGLQINVTNVIVQNVRSWITGDRYGTRHFELVGSGEGWLFSNGTYEEITWEKTSRNAQTVWLDSEGYPLTLNPGQTWVNVLSAPPIFE